MRRHLVILLGISLFVLSCGKSSDTPATAPTITAADAGRNFPSSGTLTTYYTASGSITAPAPGENQTYDYSSLTGVQAPKIGANVANASFPTATASFSGTIAYGTGAVSQTVAETDYYQTSATSLAYLGFYTDAATLTYPGVGTVSYPAQAHKAQPAEDEARFPMNYMDSFTIKTVTVTTFTANSPLLPAPNVPGQYVDSLTKNSKIIAWGTIKVSGYANAMPVLVQKVTTVKKRNYFLMNASAVMAPAPSSLLAATGVTDGVVYYDTYYRYWVPGKGYLVYLFSDGSARIYTNL